MLAVVVTIFAVLVHTLIPLVKAQPSSDTEDDKEVEPSVFVPESDNIVPRGWRSWNRFELNIDQELIKKQIDGLVRKRFDLKGKPTSLFDLGYTSIGIDDGWQKCTHQPSKKDPEFFVGSYHDKKGNLLINKTRFPNMTELVDYGHKNGITMGWYFGSCGCRERGDPHYDKDIRSAASIGFDYIKIDNCGPDTDMSKWRAAVSKSSRPEIKLENCRNYAYLATQDTCISEVFRSTEDNSPDWLSIMANLITNSQVPSPHGGLPVSRPGCWAFPDALELLNFQTCRQDLPSGTCGHANGTRRPGGLTENHTRAHFAAWCIVSSPLILGHDLHDNREYDKAWPFISNSEALRVNRAYFGNAGRRIRMSDEWTNVEVYHGSHCECVEKNWEMPHWSLWAKQLDQAGNEVAVVGINHVLPSWSPPPISLEEIFGHPVVAAPADVNIYDVWSDKSSSGDVGLNGFVNVTHEKPEWTHPFDLAEGSSFFTIMKITKPLPSAKYKALRKHRHSA